MGVKILIIEDEPKVTAFIKKGLEVHKFKAEIALDGEEGLHMALSKKFDLIIIDVGIPKINGFDVCRQIREHITLLPVLMLTALGTTADKVNGFNLGADDYLVKPFHHLTLQTCIELVERIGLTSLICL